MQYRNVITNALTILLIATTIAGCKKDATTVTPEPKPEPEKPAVKLNFTTEATNYYLTQPVQFTNTSQNAETYKWVFGDGSESTNANPVHAYERPGTYKVRLISGTASTEKTIVVKPGTASFVVFNNVVIDLDDINCFYFDGTIYNEYRHVSDKLTFRATSDTIYTSQDRIDMSFKLVGQGFRTTEGFYLTKFGHRKFDLTSTTLILPID